MPRVPADHAADAGGDTAVLAAKAALREEVWQTLVDVGDARFPGAFHRIPNFIGAEAAAEALRGLGEWERSLTVKANPDSPQLPVRQRALEDGKTVYMAVPRLADPRPFMALDPSRLTVTPRRAASIKGSSTHGIALDVEDLEPVDLVVTGCVAVDAGGARLGKGGGFADLEFALAHTAGLIGEKTVVATTVHDVQVLEEGRIPSTAHDVPVDVIVTPRRVIRVKRSGGRSISGIRWEELTAAKIAAIPLLSRLRDDEAVARRQR